MKLAMVFPGQGSQALHMLQSFETTAAVKRVFAVAQETLDQDLWTLIREGPVADLNSTINTQPVMLTAAYAVYCAWCEAGGPPPSVVAGHSLGEYTALVAAGALDFRAALPLVRFRAQVMQEAVPAETGVMAAILGLTDETVCLVCANAAGNEVVEPVNFNAPGQVVIAGHKAAVERAILAAKTHGARRAIVLPVSAPFHSSLLRPAAARFAARLAEVEFRAPSIPVINNVDVEAPHQPQHIRDALTRQACSPVRWVEVIRRMAQMGVTHVLECGPGRVLSGLTARIDSHLQSMSLTDATALAHSLQFFEHVA